MDIKEIRKARLQQIVNLKFGGVMARLADAIGRQSSYVARILSTNSDHGRNIGERLAREIEEACDLPYRYLDAPFDAEFLPDGNGWAIAEPSPPESLLAINEAGRFSLKAPRLDLNVDEDKWESGPNFDHMISSISMHRNWIQMHLSVTDPKNLRVITATGNSMVPMISHGDLLLIDTGVRSFTYDGVYVITMAGQRHVKRIQRSLDGLRVLSDNTIYKEMFVPTDRQHEIEIHGRGVYTWKGENL